MEMEQIEDREGESASAVADNLAKDTEIYSTR
jgi:hypothetical protein